ncbi:MAG: hypothetical protein IT357_07905 [Gemmatimonadaceae bacterium]|nr:hypothetical protein [Gemmatimonadaceae bacterium]
MFGSKPRNHIAGPLACLVLLVATAQGQSAPAVATASAPAAPPTCAQTLDSLDAKIRQNYAGFLLEVRGARRAAYDSVRANVAREAAATPLSDCVRPLTRLVRWFDDPHLFVYQNPVIDSASAQAARAALRRLPLDEETLRRRFARPELPLDPIEGLWYDGPTRLAIIKDPQAGTGHFVAVLLAGDTAGWSAGDVRAEIRRVGETAYAVDLRARNFARLRLEATLHRRSILRLSPGMWGKAAPLAAADSGLLDPTDVHRPRVVLRERSVVVSLPSHDPRFMRALDSAVMAAGEAIRARGLLIIDLRGNEGGSSQMSRALHPYISMPTRQPTPYDAGVPVMLSSSAQVAYARRAFGSDTSTFVRALLRRMEAALGQLVPIEDPPSAPPIDASYEGNWRVAVLVDRGTVSAAEVLVLRALRSRRAVVIGEPTAGALDYQSTQIVGLGTGDRRWALGYPTIAAHAELPARGMRGKGIPPTMRVEWATVTDAYAEVERRMR